MKIYLASSPDEKAFLEAAYKLGVKYKGLNAKQETVFKIQVLPSLASLAS